MPDQLPFDIDSFFTQNFIADVDSHYEQEVPLFDGVIMVRVNMAIINIRTKSVLKMIQRMRRACMFDTDNKHINISFEYLLCARAAKATIYSIQTQGEINAVDATFICDKFEFLRRALYLFKVTNTSIPYPDILLDIRRLRLLEICDKLIECVNDIRERYHFDDIHQN